MAIQGKFLFVVCVVFASIQLEVVDADMEKMMEMMKAIEAKCFEKYEVNEELLKGFQTGNFPDQQNLKCFVNCAMETMEVMKDGKLQYDMALKMVDCAPTAELQAIAKEILETCKNAADGFDDHCESAYAQAKCFHIKNPKLFSDL